MVEREEMRPYLFCCESRYTWDGKRLILLVFYGSFRYDYEAHMFTSASRAPLTQTTSLPREPKHHQTWCFLCEKHQKNGISYDGTDKNIDVFWFHQWKGNISSISLHDFDFLLNSWMILMKFSLFIDEIKIHQCFCPFHHLNFIFFMFRHPGSYRSDRSDWAVNISENDISDGHTIQIRENLFWSFCILFLQCVISDSIKLFHSIRIRCQPNVILPRVLHRTRRVHPTAMALDRTAETIILLCTESPLLSNEDVLWFPKHRSSVSLVVEVHDEILCCKANRKRIEYIPLDPHASTESLA